MPLILPKKTLHSLGHVQSLHLLATSLEQWLGHWEKKSSIDYQKSWYQLLNDMKDHPIPAIRELSDKLIDVDLSTQSHIQYQHSYLSNLSERILSINQDNGLITNKDRLEVPSGNKQKIVLLLDNLRSSFNVGSIFRTAEAFNIQHLCLCGYTSTPEHSQTKRSSLGSENWVEWSHWESSMECLDHWKAKGYCIYALETAKKAKSLTEIKIDRPCVLILGNERYGISEQLLDQSDTWLQLPMMGHKNSLNVAVCAGIVLYKATRDQSILSHE